MEKLKNILFNKVTIGAILLFVQLAWLLLFFYQLSSYSTVITAILGLVSVLMMLAIVSSKDNPVYKIGWLILIGLMPMFGTFLYLISANKQPAKKLRKAIQESEARIEQQLRASQLPATKSSQSQMRSRGFRTTLPVRALMPAMAIRMWPISNWVKTCMLP
jgi:cardiolipin synthase